MHACTQTPDISIIVPVYKTPEAFLTRCMESLLGQSYLNTEIIVVNDGAPDDSTLVCKKLAQKDRRIKIITQTNKGVSAARNTGLQNAQGNWCVFVDSDDCLSSEFCTQAMHAAEEFYTKKNIHPDVILFPYYKEYGEYTEAVHFFKNDFLIETPLECAHFHTTVLNIFSGTGSVWAKLYRTDFIKINGVLFNPALSIGEDVEFNFRLFACLKNAVYVHKPLYYYRYDASTASNAFNPCFADKHEQFALSLYADVDTFPDKMRERFYRLTADRIIHSILAVALRCCFHPQNPASRAKKLQSFKNVRKRPVFARAICEAEYSTMPFARKIALFCLKHRFDSIIRFICFVRRMQYRNKTKTGAQPSKS